MSDSCFPSRFDCMYSFPYTVPVSLGKKNNFLQKAGKKHLSFIQHLKYKPLRIGGYLALHWRINLYSLHVLD